MKRSGAFAFWVPIAMLALGAAGPARGQNLLANPGFDTDLSAWLYYDPSTSSTRSWTSLDAQGASDSGSGRITNEDPSADHSLGALLQCLPASGGVEYDFGGWIHIPTGQASSGDGQVYAVWMSAPGCSWADQITRVQVAGGLAGEWDPVTTTVTSPAETQSVLVYLAVLKNEAGGTLSVDFDDAFFCVHGTCDDEGTDPPPPAGAWLTTSAIPGFRFKVRVTSGTDVIATRMESDCIPETLCISGAVPGRSELFVRIVGPKPNGYLWPNLVKFSTSQLEVWIEQTRTGVIQYYQLPQASADSGTLDGLFDKLGFLP